MNYRLHLLATTLVFLIVLSAWLVPHPASAQAGGISNLAIAADRPNYTGTCPTQIILTGKLQANQPIGVVRYQFVHSDGTASAVSQLNIDRKDAFTVEETLRKESSWNDTVYLRIFLPARFELPFTWTRTKSRSRDSVRKPSPHPVERQSLSDRQVGAFA